MSRGVICAASGSLIPLSAFDVRKAARRCALRRERLRKAAPASLKRSGWEVVEVNRFWRSLVAGSAAGAAIGAYFYFRSRRRRTRALAGSVSAAQHAARSARGMLKKATGEMVTQVGRGIVSAGVKTRAAGRRIKPGGAD